jgi:DNA-binding CsgD family transcriptional regulator
MLSWKATLNLETGNWKEAYGIADKLLKNETQPAVVKIGALAVVATIKMRRGDPDALPLLLEAKAKAFETMELQRIIPVLVALLEYEWITGKNFIEKDALDSIISMVGQRGIIYENNEFAFWLLKARKQGVVLREYYEGYQVNNQTMALKAADLWAQLGCPYEQALALFEASETDKRKAIRIVHELGANAIYEKMKQEMRTSGIKSIPRGIRKTTQSHSAFLTPREMDVLRLLKEGMQNKEIAARLFISAKTVDHHISAILFKLDIDSRIKAVSEAVRREIIK